MNFYSNSKNFNSIPNLHLLNENQNLHKKDKPLLTWVNDEKINISSLNLTQQVSLDFSAFKEFYEIRRNKLKEKLIKRVYMTKSIDASMPENTLDDIETPEELVE